MYQDSPSAAAGTDPEDSPIESSETASDAALETAAIAEVADSRMTAHSFRDELARAMQAAAERERERIEASVDEDATTHVQKVRTRASAEADELKRLAEDDVSQIRDWSRTEVERIRSEADEQVGERRDRLEQHLGQHAAIIDGEIDRVSEAVESYRHELDVFFANLTTERDPSEIARMADTVPSPPDFEVIRAMARADAVGRLSRLEAADDEAEAAQAAADADIPSDDEPAGEISAEAGIATDDGQLVLAQADEDEPELVAVMDPALAERNDEGSADPETTSDASVDAPSTDAVAEAPEAAEERAAADDAEVEPVAVAMDAGDAIAQPEPVGEAEPVGAAVGSTEISAASRLLRSLTSWGSSSEHGHDLPK